LLAAVHGAQQYPHAGAQERQVAGHLEDEHHPGRLGLGGDVPNPTVEETVTAKYQASERASGWVKFGLIAASWTVAVGTRSLGRQG
jgi:hypothetical protein